MENSEMLREGILLVKRIARLLYDNQYKPLDYEDFVSFGYEGLLNAISKYDSNSGVLFTTYASYRIRGSILDAIRHNAFLSRKDLILQKTIKTIENEYYQKNGQEISLYLLSQISGYSIQEIEWIKEVGMPMACYDEVEYPKAYNENLDRVENFELRKVVRLMRMRLATRENQVLSLCYGEQLSDKEISEVLHMSLSSISQARKRALIKLRSMPEMKQLQDYL